MKVFYQGVSDVETLLDPDKGHGAMGMGVSSLSIEELELPPQAFHEFWHALDESNAMLPLSARRFQQWTVGLLRRFERHP